MKIIYSYLTADTDGSKVHVDSFMKSFVSLGEEVIDAGIVTKPFAENKATWSMWKRIWAKMIWLRLNLKVSFDLLRLAKRNDVDVVLFRFTPNHELFFPIVFLSFFYPIVLEINTLRSIEDPDNSNFIKDTFDVISLYCARKNFVVSQVLRDAVLNKISINTNKIAVVENGVDIDDFNPCISPNSVIQLYQLEGICVVGFVGSFKRWHGTEKLLELAELLRDFPVKFLLVGEGDCKRDCEKQVQERGLTEQVLFTGFIPHNKIGEYLAAMDIVTAPFLRDYYESCGGFYNSALKIFEYMAMAKAIIAPPLGQIKDVIVDGESGRLIYSEDIEAFRQEIITMCGDKEYRTRLGENARQRVATHYTWKANAEKIRSLCIEAMR